MVVAEAAVLVFVLLADEVATSGTGTGTTPVRAEEVASWVTVASGVGVAVEVGLLREGDAADTGALLGTVVVAAGGAVPLKTAARRAAVPGA